MNKKVLLMILDGWGLNKNPKQSAIEFANTPFMDKLMNNYPNSTLITYGKKVGLPEGQMGNSEVGHINIGAGRVVYQELEKINNSIEDGTFFDNPVLTKVLKETEKKGKKLHIMGLLSDGGVHSHINHLLALIKMVEKFDIKNSFVHAFTDGRDCDPKSGIDHVEAILKYTEDKKSSLASVIGRYYSMDRDNRWERIKLAYDLLVNGEGEKSNDIINSIKNSYEEGVTDEFLKPLVCVDENGNPLGKIENGDTVICFNFRTDRARQISQVIKNKSVDEFGLNTLEIDYCTFTEYDSNFKGIEVVFRNENIKDTLGEILSRNKKSQLRMAETEKYPHVTYFFSGGQEKEFEGEYRILCESPKVATYDLKPEMSSGCLSEKVVEEIKNKQPDFICINFANADMVGHTGIFDAAVKACEKVDKEVQNIFQPALDNEYQLVIIADHGNSDYMINDDGSPNTAHTKNPVPIIVISNSKIKSIKNGVLGDVAPTILELMEIEKPQKMTCNSLIIKN